MDINFIKNLYESLPLKNIFKNDLSKLKKYLKEIDIGASIEDPYKIYLLKLFQYENSDYILDNDILENHECNNLDDKSLVKVWRKILIKSIDDEYSQTKNMSINKFIEKTEKFLNNKKDILKNYLSGKEINTNKLLEEYSTDKNKILYDRNKKWIKKIDKELKKEDIIVIICGIGHIDIVNHYVDKGWKKTLIPIKISKK